MRKWLLLFVVLTLISCGNRQTPAPVSELSLSNSNLHAYTHKVKRGETLYSIAFLYDADYKKLAQINNIHPPYILAIGQVIRLYPKTTPRTRMPVRHFKASKKTYWHKNNKWFWPVKGPIRASFAPRLGRKGIDIGGSKGTKIHAAQGGIVAYSGSGLENYGNLIIIKHSNNYLTAYGNNAKNLVREGQYINAGQIIAEMGIINHKYYGLHFEIRKKGKPLDPYIFLRHS